MLLVAGTNFFFGLVTASVVYFAVSTFISYWRLRHIPGPWLAKWSSLWVAYHTLNSNLYRAGEEALRKYGSPVRISPGIILHDDPEFRKLNMAPRSSFTRGGWYEGMKLDPRQHNVLSMQDEKLHGIRRAMLKPGYTGKEIVNLEDDVNSVLLQSLGNVQKYAENSEKFDLAVLISYFAIDTLCKIGFSRESGFTKHNRDQFNFFKSTAEFFPILELSLNVPVIRNILNSKFVQRLAGPKPSDKVGLGAIMGMAHEETAIRFADQKDGEDMLASFIRHGLTQEECEVESVIQILAGADSTATALRTTLWHILSCPKAYRKLNEEISSAVESGDVSWPVIKDEQARKLPYLDACIREGTRILMPLTGTGTVKTPAEGYTLNGVFIPGGTEVGVSNYAMLRREDIFGPDADTYRPERFIEGDSADIKRCQQVQELVFASGRFQCLGQQIALLEMRKVLFELFRRYDLTVVDPLRGVHVASNAIVVQRKMFVRAYPKLVS